MVMFGWVEMIEWVWLVIELVIGLFIVLNMVIWLMFGYFFLKVF